MKIAQYDHRNKTFKFKGGFKAHFVKGKLVVHGSQGILKSDSDFYKDAQKEILLFLANQQKSKNHE